MQGPSTGWSAGNLALSVASMLLWQFDECICQRADSSLVSYLLMLSQLLEFKRTSCRRGSV